MAKKIKIFEDKINIKKEMKARIEKEISIIKNDLVETVVKIVTNVDDKFDVFDKAIKELIDYMFKDFDKTTKDMFGVLKYVVGNLGLKVTRNIAALKKLEEEFAKFDDNVKEIKDKVDIFNLEIKKNN